MTKSIIELLTIAELQSKQNAALLVQLQAKMALMAAIVESADDAIISESIDGTILFWNHGSENIFGFTAQEAVGKQMSLIIPDEFSEQKKNVREEIRQGRTVRFETVRRRKNGELFHVSVTSSPMRDFSDVVTGSSSIERDITDLKKMQGDLLELNADLKESNERFYTIFEHNPVGMSLTNFETSILENVNTVFLNIFGFTREEVIGKTAVELNIYEAKERKEFMDKLLHDNNLNGIEVLVTKKNGEQFWGLAWGQIIYIHGVKFLATSFQDISYRKRKEQVIKDKNIDLREKNEGPEDRNRDLDQKNTENQNVSH